MRHLEPRLADEPPGKGKWWRAADKTLWSCPACGQVHVLSPHRVNYEGIVEPSVVCAKCDFHEYVALEECSPEAVTR
jgi:C4-type Zn-finger protein